MEVTAFQPLPGATGAALEVWVTEAPAQTDPPMSGSRGRAGFSYEDALFRMRWGWAAHEAARRAAREEEL